MVFRRMLINWVVALSVATIPAFVRAQEPRPGSPDALPTPSCVITQPVRAEPPKDPNADRFGFGPWYVNADRTIWAGWDVGNWVSGRKGNKVMWIRPRDTPLKVTGRRLDADATLLKTRIPCCYPTGFQATRLIFPTAGCWLVTATAGASSLTFIASIH